MSDAEFDEHVQKSDFGLGPADRKSYGPESRLNRRADTWEGSFGYSQPRTFLNPSLAECPDVE